MGLKYDEKEIKRNRNNYKKEGGIIPNSKSCNCLHFDANRNWFFKPNKLIKILIIVKVNPIVKNTYHGIGSTNPSKVFFGVGRLIHLMKSLGGTSFQWW